MSILAISMVLLYASFGLVSAFFLVRWLHANKREELGNSLIIEIFLGLVFACFWPVTIPMMIENS